VKDIKILAIDQSTKCTGWSLWKDEELSDYGLLESDKTEKNPIERMQQMYFMIKDLIINRKPDYVVIESVQFQSNYRTYSQLSQMQGIIFSILFELDIGFNIIEATAWRKFCNIQGRKRIEQKASTIQMVRDRFVLNVGEDIADAIGIGCWAVNNIKTHVKN